MTGEALQPLLATEGFLDKVKGLLPAGGGEGGDRRGPAGHRAEPTVPAGTVDVLCGAAVRPTGAAGEGVRGGRGGGGRRHPGGHGRLCEGPTEGESWRKERGCP